MRAFTAIVSGGPTLPEAYVMIFTGEITYEDLRLDKDQWSRKVGETDFMPYPQAQALADQINHTLPS